MSALALISRNSGLYRQLVALLDGADWLVDWVNADAVERAELRQEVIVLDAAHPMAATWKASHAKPTLLVLDETPALESADLANDIIFQPLQREELLARLGRLAHRRETERQLLKTMEFLESLIEASVDAIIATDMEQRVVLFNPSAERVSGRHVSDVIGKVRLEDLLGRASAELVMQRLLAPEHGGEGRLEPTTLDMVDIHGMRVPVQLSASLIYEHDAPSAIVLIVADLRDRLRVEERLAEAQKKLAFTEKQGVLAELAGTAAHELNQPLTSMMAYAELLLRQSEPDSAASKAAEVLIREAERMAEIVRKIGKITRYETTAYVGHQKIFDLERAADSSGEPGAKG